MFAYVGLTQRFAPLATSSRLLKVDIEERRVVKDALLPPPHFDLLAQDTPTGGGMQRGARGVVWYAGEVHVATFDAIHVFDPNLRVLRSITCNRFNDLHEFLVSPIGYTVTCSHSDAVIWCDHEGEVKEQWVATTDTALRNCFPEIPYLERFEEDWRSVYPRPNPTHLNAVCRLDGRTFVGLHHQSVLWCIEKGEIVHDARPFG